VLRGNDARAQASDFDVGEVPPAFWRRRAGAHHAFLFLSEVPPELVTELGVRDEAGELTLRPSAMASAPWWRRNTFTGKTYNSVENIPSFSASAACRSMLPNKRLPRPSGRPRPSRRGCRCRRARWVRP